MKQLIALLSTIVLTFTFCVSLACAESILVKPTSMLVNDDNIVYKYNENSAGLIYAETLAKLTPLNIGLDNTNDTFGFSKAKVINEHNYFFEFSIIFNDKLQQLIAFFTHDDNEHSEYKGLSNSFATKTSTQKCETNT